jgi:hypothetical protein
MSLGPCRGHADPVAGRVPGGPGERPAVDVVSIGKGSGDGQARAGAGWPALPGPRKATVNFSVPDEVKEAFHRAYEGQNERAVIAGLMRQAVEEVERRRRRRAVVDRLIRARDQRPAATDEAVRAAREKGRP